MNRMIKYTMAAAVTGALAVAAAAPSEAAHGRNTAAAIGFGAGVLAGAAAANVANNGYNYEPSYGYYAPGYYGDYAYAPGPYVVPDESYAYEPAPAYSYYGYGSTTGGKDLSSRNAP